MDVEITDDNRLVFRAIGGVVDLFVSPGPTLEGTVEKLSAITGRMPRLDVRFLGLQQSRYGYRTLEDMQDVVANYTRAGLPLDVLWFDIEYPCTGHLADRLNYVVT